MKSVILISGMVALAGGAAVWSQQALDPTRGDVVINTPHNLSTSGPDVIRAATEEQVCIFCHSPHNSTPVQPLWNRQASVSAYVPYTSSALDSRPGQPTGSSKLCLSCHDGTIALGNVVSRDQMILMSQGITTLPPGSSNLGTDLSDDHPVSFRFDAALAGRDPNLIHPGGLPEGVRLDPNLELQCTTCHEPHNNTFGDFLTMSNENSALCNSCHQITTTSIAAHQDCASCHQSHSAPSGPFLMKGEAVTQSCLNCHDGSTLGAHDLSLELLKFAVHDTNAPADPVDPVPSSTSCISCHNPHTMEQGDAIAPDVHPNFGRVPGVNGSGSPVAAASFEFEVCFRCHADDPAVTTPHIPRQIVQTNTRLEFALGAASYHPVQGAGRNSNVPSLRPGWTESSVMYCSDCHSSDTGDPISGTMPVGTHGSNEPPLLKARYETLDFTPESSSAYALCYECHYRDGADGLLQDISFPHREHVAEQNTPCSVCHDAHGISSAQGSVMANSHLINFDTSVVFPHPSNGRLEFRDAGTFAGSCTLTCHGVVHDDMKYPE